MSGFSEAMMREKLAKLSHQQEAIQTLSLWLLHHQRQHSKVIVDVWLKEVRQEVNAHRLVNLIYLANDVIQNSRKKNPEFADNFFVVLEPAFRHAAKISGPDLDRAMMKVLRVWKDRLIYSIDQITHLEAISLRRRPVGHSHSTPALIANTQPIAVEAYGTTKPPTSQPDYDDEIVSRNTRELLDSLRKLDVPPSADADIRHKIASYPETIANPQMLETIKNSEEAQQLLSQITEAEPLVRDYCQRLAEEMLERRNLQKQLDDLVVNVRSTVEYQEKLVREVRRVEERVKADLVENDILNCILFLQVKKAYNSLPDLTEMEGQSGNPLPSLENLFDLN
uniref:CID domain-containing protein n=1 Tax=Heterorhabditis bacteriophora TaxID=37862 RepID=A0A1I7XAK3_HETBA